MDEDILHLLRDYVLPKLRVKDLQSLAHASQQLQSVVDSAAPSCWEAVAHASLPKGHPVLLREGTLIQQVHATNQSSCSHTHAVRSCSPHTSWTLKSGRQLLPDRVLLPIVQELTSLAAYNDSICRGRLTAHSLAACLGPSTHSLSRALVLPLLPSMHTVLVHRSDSLLLMRRPSQISTSPAPPAASTDAAHALPPVQPHSRSTVSSPDGSLVAGQGLGEECYFLARISQQPTPSVSCQSFAVPRSGLHVENMQISCLAFSPCSKMLAISCIYDCGDENEIFTQLSLVDDTGTLLAQCDPFLWGQDLDWNVADNQGFQWSPMVQPSLVCKGLRRRGAFKLLLLPCTSLMPCN